MGLRHRSLPQQRINPDRLAHRQSLGNPTDSSRAKFALTPPGLYEDAIVKGSFAGV
jgi:hypothetical protein